MAALELFRGDTVLVRGKKRRDTGTSPAPGINLTLTLLLPSVLIVLSADDVEEGKPKASQLLCAAN